MSRTPYRFPRDLKYLVDPLRNWSYLPLTPNFYCPFCNNLDPHRPPVDEKGTPRILEADSLGLAPRRPVVKDFTGRRELLGEDFTARQPTRWQYLGTRRLSFDIPYEDLLVGGRDGCPSCALLFDAGERFEAPGYVKERYLGRNTNIIGDGEPIDGVDMGGPEDVAGLYVDIFRFEWNDHLSMRVRTFSGIDIDFFTLPGKLTFMKVIVRLSHISLSPSELIGCR
jgi:hypothetical protein